MARPRARSPAIHLRRIRPERHPPGWWNPLPGLSIYGDWRAAFATSNAGKGYYPVATRLNIDVDFKLTGTERIHAFFTPLQKNNKFTRCEFGGGAIVEVRP